MFLIAPALALLTTVSMFSYSIIADGFGTTIRVRQIMWVDGKSGDTVERTRVTLFSGISPRDGLKFARDAEVMLYPASSGQPWNELDSQLQRSRIGVRIDGESQVIDSGVLPSRSQTQFVSHRVRQSLGRLNAGKITKLQPEDIALAERRLSESAGMQWDEDDPPHIQAGFGWITRTIKRIPVSASAVDRSDGRWTLLGNRSD